MYTDAVFISWIAADVDARRNTPTRLSTLVFADYKDPAICRLLVRAFMVCFNHHCLQVWYTQRNSNVCVFRKQMLSTVISTHPERRRIMDTSRARATTAVIGFQERTLIGLRSLADASTLLTFGKVVPLGTTSTFLSGSCDADLHRG